ncbi:hypothetical protein [uncultured Negativibacillus sp.]|uniref:hypothetical protein n=1 Tax=uncultured Negativibacillus sp. TaxID=1980696 RepID=UPI0025F09B06|nr:hypothetical protein [uncultured Negativibacillus sp.]
MKKVLSVAMASAMVLGMGANAFAIQYASGSSDTAAWPAGFQFDGKMFVTNKDGDIVTGSNTKLDGKTRINFNEGDVIWMPLYANNQKEYTVVGAHQGYDKVEATTVSFDPVLWDEFTAEDLIAVDADATVKPFEYRDNQNKVLYWYNRDVADTASYTGSHGLTAAEVKAGWRIVKIPNRVEDRYGKMVENVRVLLNGKDVTGKGGITDAVAGIEYDSADVKFSISYDAANDKFNYTVVSGASHINLNNPGDVAHIDASWLYKVGTNNAYGPATVKYDLSYEALNAAVPTVVKELAKVTTGVLGGQTVTMDNVAPAVDTDVVLKAGVEVVANLPEVAAVNEDLGEIEENKWETSGNYVVNTVKYGHYTGNIDKNWSINLIEEDNGVADLVEKAELYKADEVDYLSYKDHTNEIMPNAVYLKVTLKDTWKLAKAADMKYYVYVADNKSNKNTTNKVWVSGKYEASDIRTVDFTWTNDASKPAVWKVAKDENGVAVFDFADKAFFQVKMYAGESMYLDLSTAYDKAIAGDFDEADACFSFDNENANFSRTGTLILVSDDASLVPYQVTEDGYTKVDAEYVEDFAIAHTNEKVDGFVFETKELGNYVLSTEEVEVEEDDKDDNTQEVVVPDDDNKETNNNSKPNPVTGAEDFVGLAVSLAVVSVAAAGALALKK